LTKSQDLVATDIELWRDSTRRFRGRVVSLDDTLNGDEYTVAVTAVDYSQLLMTRGLVTDLVFSQVAQGTIAWNLIQHTQAQPSGDLGITAGTITDGSVLRDRPYTAGNGVGKLIDELSAVQYGFDWWIDDQLRLQVRYPRRSQVSGLLLAHGAGVAAIKRKSVATEFRNYVRESGDPSTTPQVAQALPDARGRWELHEANAQVSNTATLLEKANGALAERSSPRASYAIALDAGAYDALPLLLGDLPKLVVQRGRLNVDDYVRVMELGFQVDESGKEEVSAVVLEEP
jgi:hypothetical protein